MKANDVNVLFNPIVRILPREVRPRKLKGALTGVTPREREVWALLCRGLVNKEIGTALGITHKTVEKHRISLYAKLGARSLVTVVLLGVKHGLVEVPA